MQGEELEGAEVSVWQSKVQAERNEVRSRRASRGHRRESGVRCMRRQRGRGSRSAMGATQR